jgi:hypothetical protein
MMDTSPMKMGKKDKDKCPDQYEIDSWARTVIEALEIMQDEKKMKYVKGCLLKKKKALMSLDEVKERVEADE